MKSYLWGHFAKSFKNTIVIQLFLATPLREIASTPLALEDLGTECFLLRSHKKSQAGMLAVTPGLLTGSEYLFVVEAFSTGDISNANGRVTGTRRTVEAGVWLGHSARDTHLCQQPRSVGAEEPISMNADFPEDSFQDGLRGLLFCNH